MDIRKMHHTLTSLTSHSPVPLHQAQIPSIVQLIPDRPPPIVQILFVAVMLSSCLCVCPPVSRVRNVICLFTMRILWPVGLRMITICTHAVLSVRVNSSQKWLFEFMEKLLRPIIMHPQLRNLHQVLLFVDHLSLIRLWILRLPGAKEIHRAPGEVLFLLGYDDWSCGFRST